MPRRLPALLLALSQVLALAASAHAAIHPQTVATATELANAQGSLDRQPTADARITVRQHLTALMSNKPHDPLDQFLEAVGPVEKNLGGYAVAARLLADGARIGLARDYLIARCSVAHEYWTPRECDLDQSERLLNFALAYDMLHSELVGKGAAESCRETLYQAGRWLAHAAEGGDVDGVNCLYGKGGWWSGGYDSGNHLPVNISALGIAAQALTGEFAAGTPEYNDVRRWRSLARDAMDAVSRVHDLVMDGSWHEGIGYESFMLSRIAMFSMGESRDPSYVADKSNLSNGFGRFFLYNQQPLKPSASVATWGDWNWVRPEAVLALRWAARRHHSGYANLAADRWLRAVEGGLLRREFLNFYVLEALAWSSATPTASTADLARDEAFNDQGSFVMRESLDSGPTVEDVVGILKAGRIGGSLTGAIERSAFPGEKLDFGHDHMDDLSLVIFGRGGWLLPEAVGYNCCYSSTERPSDYLDYYSTPWHNSFLFDGQGQLGDKRTETGDRGVSATDRNPDWAFTRKPAYSSQASFKGHAVARVEGRSLYTSHSLDVARLERTVHFSRPAAESSTTLPAYFVLRDRAQWSGASRVEQVFHAMKTASQPEPGWIRLDNTTTSPDAIGGNTYLRSDAALGIRAVSPRGPTVVPGTRMSDRFEEWMHPVNRVDPSDPERHLADFGEVRIGASGPQAVFLELLWPTTMSDWSGTSGPLSRPVVEPLSTAAPELGLAASFNSGWTDRWLFNDLPGDVEAGPLRLEGGSGGDFAFVRLPTDDIDDRVQPPTRLPASIVFVGSGRLVYTNSREEEQILIDTAGRSVELEILFDRNRATITYRGELDGVSFYGQGVIPVSNGQDLLFSRDETGVTGLVTLGNQQVRIDRPDEDPDRLSPPVLLGPVLVCAPGVTAMSRAPGATVRVFEDGSEIASQGPDGTGVFTSLPAVRLGARMTATQQLAGPPSAESDPLYVVDVSSEYPTPPGLPQPAVRAPAYACGGAVAVSPVARGGSTTRVFGSQGQLGTRVTLSSSVADVNLDVPPTLAEGDQLAAEYEICSQTVTCSTCPPVPVSPAPTELPEPMVDPVYEDSEYLVVWNVVPGALVEVLDRGTIIASRHAVGGGFGALMDLGGLAGTRGFLVRQRLCSAVAESKDEIVARPCEMLSAPVVAPISAGAAYVEVLHAEVGARVTVFVETGNGYEELGDGSAPVVVLYRPVVEGELVLVRQQLGVCVGEMMSETKVGPPGE